MIQSSTIYMNEVQNAWNEHNIIQTRIFTKRNKAYSTTTENK